MSPIEFFPRSILIARGFSISVFLIEVLLLFARNLRRKKVKNAVLATCKSHGISSLDLNEGESLGNPYFEDLYS